MSIFKKSVLMFALLSFSVSATNCYGPFKLTQKLHNWNGTLGDKYINALVFVGLGTTQVYTIAAGLDAIVFNSIQFWTGDNPIVMNEGEKETRLITDAGKTFQITASKSQFEIVQLSGVNKGETAILAFNEKTQVWSVTSGNTTIDIAKVISKETATYVEAYHLDGRTSVHQITE